jgi:hypothetical protein
VERMDHENSTARWKCLMEILSLCLHHFTFSVLPVWDPSIPQMRWKGGIQRQPKKWWKEEERYAIPLAIYHGGELAGSRLFNM